MAAPKPKASASSRVSTASATRKTGQRPLRLVLLSLLQKSGRTMSVEEMADQAIKAGYRTTSKNLKDSVWVAMGHIPEAERDPRGGYRLKKGQRS